jgi:hypothetical protein
MSSCVCSVKRSVPCSIVRSKPSVCNLRSVKELIRLAPVFKPTDVAVPSRSPRVWTTRDSLMAWAARHELRQGHHGEPFTLSRRACSIDDVHSCIDGAQEISAQPVWTTLASGTTPRSRGACVRRSMRSTSRIVDPCEQSRIPTRDTAPCVQSRCGVRIAAPWRLTCAVRGSVRHQRAWHDLFISSDGFSWKGRHRCHPGRRATSTSPLVPASAAAGRH